MNLFYNRWLWAFVFATRDIKPSQESTITYYYTTIWEISAICIGNSMICSDICHKYHEWYFKIVIRNFTSR